MNKIILEVLKLMLADYESALNYSTNDVEFEFLRFSEFLESKNLELGICNWLGKTVLYSVQRHTIPVLLEDIEIEFNGISCWYPISRGFCSMNQVKQNCLIPRIEHLQRTIARLENELKNQAS